MLLAYRSLEWDAGHRLVGHESKCATLHGHRYKAEIGVAGNKGLDTVGRVVDFSCIKGIVGAWIDEQWDHTMILNPRDPLIAGMDERELKALMGGGRKPYIMPQNLANPTAENMAAHLAMVANQLLNERGAGLTVVEIKLYETPNCFAVWRPDPTR